MSKESVDRVCKASPRTRRNFSLVTLCGMTPPGVLAENFQRCTVPMRGPGYPAAPYVDLVFVDVEAAREELMPLCRTASGDTVVRRLDRASAPDDSFVFHNSRVVALGGETLDMGSVEAAEFTVRLVFDGFERLVSKGAS